MPYHLRHSYPVGVNWHYEEPENYRPVRNISAVLMAIGTGKKPIDWAKEVLLAQDRKAADVTATANGLYLTQVFYPENFALPPAENDFFRIPFILGDLESKN